MGSWADGDKAEQEQRHKEADIAMEIMAIMHKHHMDTSDALSLLSKLLIGFIFSGTKPAGHVQVYNTLDVYMRSLLKNPPPREER